MGNPFISGLQTNKFNPAIATTTKPLFAPEAKPVQTLSGSASRLGDYNLSGAMSKNRFAGTSANPILNFGTQNPGVANGALPAVMPLKTPSANSPVDLNFAESKSVSDVAYDGKQGEVYKFPDGTYWRVDRAEEKDSGFKAVVMRRVVSGGNAGWIDDPSDNRAVVGFAGTNGIDDIDDDIKQGIGMTPEQYDQALAFTQSVQQEAAANGETVNLTGHSLGGGLATYCSIQTGLHATAINSAPLTKNKVPDGVNYDGQITQYHSKGEILTDLDNLNPTDTRPGKDVEVKAAHDEISHWWALLSFGGTEGANFVISILNHMLGNTAPEVAEPEKV